MKFMDFDREYTSIVYKSEAGNITLGEYVERGEELLNKVKAEAYQEGFKAGVEDTTVRIDTLKAEAKAETIDKLLDAIKKSIISIEARDRGSDYSAIYNWIEMIAERVKEQEHERNNI